MPEQVTSTTKTYETAPSNKGSSLSLTLAWFFIIIVLLALIALYVVYFIGADNYKYGIPWMNSNVADTTASIAPVGNTIYFVNGASITRSTNPDYLYISTPTQVPYLNRTFMIFNKSSSNQLELRPSEGVITTLNEHAIGSFFIQPLTGVLFYWFNKNTIVPLMVGDSPNQNT